MGLSGRCKIKEKHLITAFQNQDLKALTSISLREYEHQWGLTCQSSAFMSFGDPIMAFVIEHGRLRRLTLPGNRNKVSGFFSEESINFHTFGPSFFNKQ